MDKKIKRHNWIIRFEHWTVALSGIALIFTGLGCLPLFKRYYITEIPGFKWTADFYIVTKLHYIFAIFFTFTVFFHIFYHSLRKDFGLLPKKEDFLNSLKVILADLGLLKTHPPCDKWLPEQKLAYIGVGLIALGVLLTGIAKVLKNLEWVYFGPQLESTLNLLHTILGGLFILLFFIHIFFVLAIKANRRNLLRAMLTGYVEEDYVKKRHSLWYERLIKRIKDGV